MQFCEFFEIFELVIELFFILFKKNNTVEEIGNRIEEPFVLQVKKQIEKSNKITDTKIQAFDSKIKDLDSKLELVLEMISKK